MIVAVVPMKPLALAKRRLSAALPERQRRALVRAMLCDVLTALSGCAQVGRTFVVTADPEVIELAARHQAGHIPEVVPAGLNKAVATAAGYLEDIGAGAMLVVPGDVPLVTRAEIGELASLLRPRGMAIVPAHDRDGTNALLLSPPAVLAPSFGPGSFKRHFETGSKAGLAPAVCPLEGLGRDIDEAADLDILMRVKESSLEYGFLRQAAGRDFSGTRQTMERERA
jgi:2-phospho-L-lactate guanylyltransferase